MTFIQKMEGWKCIPTRIVVGSGLQRLYTLVNNVHRTQKQKKKKRKVFLPSCKTLFAVVVIITFLTSIISHLWIIMPVPFTTFRARKMVTIRISMTICATITFHEHLEIRMLLPFRAFHYRLRQFDSGDTLHAEGLFPVECQQFKNRFVAPNCLVVQRTKPKLLGPCWTQRLDTTKPNPNCLLHSLRVCR